jgi:peptide/nickel transport system ATP-binding protein
MTTTEVSDASARSEQAPLVEVGDLRVSFGVGGSAIAAVRGISFTIAAGKSVAIVGESGSGKSVTARSLVGLAGSGGRVSAQRLQVAGADVRGYSERQWRRLRGRHIGLVLQDALASLDPARTIGQEIAEPLRTHHVVPTRQIGARVRELLTSVGVPNPEARAAQYPHQLSGGLRQRALIASAIAADPELLIADEPTTALDVTVQAQVLDLLIRSKNERAMALLLISHDLAVVARVADYVLVMKDGAFVEQGPTAQILHDPHHPYTQQLIAAIPANHARGTRLSPNSADARPRPAPVIGDVVLEARNLVKSFSLPGRGSLIAVNDVSLTLRAGQTLGIVGESGSGKTTTARLLLGLAEPESGTVLIDGRTWAERSADAKRRLRHQIPVIYQDPLSSFDPRYPVGAIIAEPLAAIGVPRARRRQRVLELLAQVGLRPALADRRPRTLSGGQRQRVAIARALAAEPRIIVCDEPVSALDVSVQAQILDLFAALQSELQVSYLFISHHLGVIYHVSDQILVMKDGRIVEHGDVEDVFHHPQHEYTKQLLAAVLTLAENA